MESSQRNILVTSALPYANGSIHIGHLVEYIQTDIWVRFQKMRGHQCLYVCADDAHGTPIMLHAEQQGISPETLIERMQKEHEQDFAAFLIEFDHYHSTHSDENRTLSAQLYQTLKDRGHIHRRVIKHLYDPERKIFLPDRYIRGTCPKCNAQEQYGDGCEVCNTIYHPSELNNPVSVLSGATPVARATEHLFFKLPDFTGELKQWMQDSGLQKDVRNKLEEWFATGLQEWDISRDPPYFGFAIPGESDKYFYVWLDAPVGYLASLQKLCTLRNLDFNQWLDVASPSEMYHFIGKDIMYFHCLFWPAMLHGAGLRKPSGVFVHGFLTVNGKKMSKTRGTFIRARTWLEHLSAESLRYYFALHLNATTEDIDLNLNDFVQRINSDLVGKVVNIASRCCGFIHRYGDAKLAQNMHDPGLHAEFIQLGESIASAYERRNYSRAMRMIMTAADSANQYISEHKPWLLAKEKEQQETLIAVCSMSLNLFRILCIWLQPVLPELATKVKTLFNEQNWCWDDYKKPLCGDTIRPFTPLLTRIDKKQITAVLEQSKNDLQAGTPADTEAIARNTPSDTLPSDGQPIDIEDFQRLDLRVARVVEAKTIAGADKLLHLVLDAGEEKYRNVYAGIKSAYTAESLCGRLTVLVANLPPRKMRFGTSEGMVLAAGEGGSEIFLLAPDSGATPGMKIR